MALHMLLCLGCLQIIVGIFHPLHLASGIRVPQQLKLPFSQGQMSQELSKEFPGKAGQHNYLLCSPGRKKIQRHCSESLWCMWVTSFLLLGILAMKVLIAHPLIIQIKSNVFQYVHNFSSFVGGWDGGRVTHQVTMALGGFLL